MHDLEIRAAGGGGGGKREEEKEKRHGRSDKAAEESINQNGGASSIHGFVIDTLFFRFLQPDQVDVPQFKPFPVRRYAADRRPAANGTQALSVSSLGIVDKWVQRVNVVGIRK
jgi:hypothetical protein